MKRGARGLVGSPRPGEATLKGSRMAQIFRARAIRNPSRRLPFRKESLLVVSVRNFKECPFYSVAMLWDGGAARRIITDPICLQMLPRRSTGTPDASKTVPRRLETHEDVPQTPSALPLFGWRAAGASGRVPPIPRNLGLLAQSPVRPLFSGLDCAPRPAWPGGAVGGGRG